MRHCVLGEMFEISHRSKQLLLMTIKLIDANS